MLHTADFYQIGNQEIDGNWSLKGYLDKMDAGPTNEAHVKPIVYHFSSKYSVGSGADTTKPINEMIIMMFIQFFVTLYCVK